MPFRLPTSHASPWSGRGEAFAVFLLCLAVRLATTIRHIEDADSLRFALGVLDFDVTRLQPQFPGYPAFMGAAKLLYALTGSYAIAFSLLGGGGLFVLLHYALALTGWRFRTPRGLLLAALFVFNPMIWLLGNRYMSDLSGAACLLAAFYHLTRGASDHLTHDASGSAGLRHAAAGFFLAGLLTGWRLSFAPLLLLPLLASLAQRGAGPHPKARRVAERLLAGAAGTLAWLVPFIAVTGWNTLIETARAQTGAHFTATGGTYVTESAWPLRARRIVEYLWTDGLGAWAPDRHPVTALVGVGALIFLGLGIATVARARRDGPWPRSLVLLAVSCGVYALWILLFQNVVHQTRHVLPLVPPLLMLLAAGLAPGTPTNGGSFMRALRRSGVAVFLAAYAATGLTLAVQHTRPAAIAQVVERLREDSDPGRQNRLIVGAPWVVKCLSAQGVRAEFLTVDTPEELDALRALDPARAVVTVGDYTDRIMRAPARRETFHHNPYVNRLGARVDVLWYAPIPSTPAARP